VHNLCLCSNPLCSLPLQLLQLVAAAPWLAPPQFTVCLVPWSLAPFRVPLMRKLLRCRAAERAGRAVGVSVQTPTAYYRPVTGLSGVGKPTLRRGSTVPKSAGKSKACVRGETKPARQRQQQRTTGLSDCNSGPGLASKGGRNIAVYLLNPCLCAAAHIGYEPAGSLVMAPT
jgi:hypothetical protein